MLFACFHLPMFGSPIRIGTILSIVERKMTACVRDEMMDAWFSLTEVIYCFLV